LCALRCGQLRNSLKWKMVAGGMCGSDAVSVVDIERLIEAKRIPVGKAPYDMVLIADGKFAFTNCRGSDDVYAISCPTEKLSPAQRLANARGC